MTDLPDRNLLGQETSPYLRQHEDNPVHWMPWGDAAFAAARAHNRPILLSVGYAACHWCHVMAHESFEDPDVAAVMNRHFINIKVDREERPDVDQIYQHALALLGQQGGWPLTMFLTPAREPFWGGTYFPKTPAYGRPGFVDVLERISEIYTSTPDSIEQNRAGLAKALLNLGRSESAGAVTPAHLNQVAELLLKHVDMIHGGFGGAPKFPQPFLFEFLWRTYLRTGDDRYRAAVTRTLTHMAEGGIYDHLGGGFARYAVDAQWLVPHFEKMLYDNAQLIRLYTLVWQDTREPLFRRRVSETVDWLGREMQADGAFAAALDADSEGEEGAFYVWSRAEIGDILGEDAAFFSDVYDVTTSGNWEGHTILNRLHRVGEDDEDQEKTLAPLRSRLLAARAGRERPGRDDKVLADWNGLLIDALALAGLVFEEPDWIALSAKAFDAIRTKLAANDHGRLFHSYCGGQAQHRALLDDYANMANAALTLFEATQAPDYIATARQWEKVIQDDFFDPENGGYFVASADASDLIVRPKTIHDAAVPAGNASVLNLLARLHYLTGEARYREQAEGLIRTFGGELEKNVMGLSSFLNASETLWACPQIVIRGAGQAADDLRRALYGVSLPDRVVQVLSEDADLPEGHPARGKGMKDGRATAYVCREQACSPPITEAEALGAALSGQEDLA